MKFFKWLKEKFNSIWQAFFYKDGKISKTSVFLSSFSITLLVMWIFQSLFAGVTLLGWWLVPHFDVAAAVAVMSIYSALYVINRSKLVDRSATADLEEVTAIREKVESIATAVGGQPATQDKTPSDEEKS